MNDETADGFGHDAMRLLFCLFPEFVLFLKASTQLQFSAGAPYSFFSDEKLQCSLASILLVCGTLLDRKSFIWWWWQRVLSDMSVQNLPQVFTCVETGGVWAYDSYHFHPHQTIQLALMPYMNVYICLLCVYTAHGQYWVKSTHNI